MASQSYQWNENIYIKDVSVLLQSGGFRTRGTTTDTDNVKGATAIWKTIGSVEAVEMPAGISVVPALNPAQSTVTATIKNYAADLLERDIDMDNMTVNEQAYLAGVGANAIGRTFDGVLWDAIAGSGVTPIGSTGDTLSGETILTRALQAASGISGLSIDANTTFCALPAIAMANCLLVDQFANSQYTGDNPLMKAIGARTWMGVTFLPVEDKVFTDRAPAASNIDIMLWHRDCVGRVTRGLSKVRKDWESDKHAWRISQTVSGCAAILQSTGVKLIRGLMPTTVSMPA